MLHSFGLKLQRANRKCQARLSKVAQGLQLTADTMSSFHIEITRLMQVCEKIYTSSKRNWIE